MDKNSSIENMKYIFMNVHYCNLTIGSGITRHQQVSAYNVDAQLVHIDSLLQHCSISIANALEIL